MKNSQDYFTEKSYVLLDEVFDDELCDSLTAHMFKLKEQGSLAQDGQCPLSWSVYGDSIFDELLEKLAPSIGEMLGKELLPTYTYCRLYQNGEVLERHVDRPACEISGTMTLGYSGRKVWPIYVSPDNDDQNGTRIDIPKGSLLMYRGEDLVHWRPEFKGDWQVQVFFHYVDANGPHKDQAYDGRSRLGMSNTEKAIEAQEEVPTDTPDGDSIQRTAIPDDNHTTPVLVNKKDRHGPLPIYGGVMIPSWDLELPGAMTYNAKNEPHLVFTDKECEDIIAFSEGEYADVGALGGEDKKGKVNKEIRNVDLYKIEYAPESKWLFDRISRVVSIANAEHFDYEIMGITHELQLLHYKAGAEPGHYNWHMDIGPGTSATRKISVSVQLSDPDNYSGGDLTINSNGQDILVTRERGAINLFPSYSMHRVSPMERGERWALVIWVHGTKRFR